jgi:hypothetical protein
MLINQGRIKKYISGFFLSFILSFLFSSCTSSQISTPSTSILAHSLDIQEIILDDDNIFLITEISKQIDNKYVKSSRIQWIPKSGGNLTTLVEEDLEYHGLVLDYDYVYWIAVSPVNSKNNTQYVKKIEKTGGEPTILYEQDGYI